MVLTLYEVKVTAPVLPSFPSRRRSVVIAAAGLCVVSVGAGWFASCAADGGDFTAPAVSATPSSEAPEAIEAQPAESSSSSEAWTAPIEDACAGDRPFSDGLAAGGVTPVVPLDAQQLIRVTADSWKDYAGRLQRYERRCARVPWVPVGEATDVMLGRRGMAWGRGRHPEADSGPVKAEHDYKSPAGVFELGEARGYAKQPPEGTTWPFRHSGSSWRCMDNRWSEAYNTFVPTNGMLAPTPPGQASREVLFDLMVYVLHNTDPVQRGAGSCVFLHVWAKQGTPTQGCVAMERATIQQLLAWMSLDRHPVIAMLPLEVLGRVAEAWGLPTD